MARIEIYATPSTLYRYRPLSDTTFVRELSTILEKFVFCPLIKQMNDPMEGSHRESEMFRKSRFYETKLAEVLEAKAKLGVASFSEVFDHEPMWAHYASNFTGICVAYSFRKLLKQLPDEYEFIRMTYSEKPPVLLRSKKKARTRWRNWRSQRKPCAG